MIKHLKPVNQAQDALADKLVEIANTIRDGNPEGVFRAVIVLDGKNIVESILAGAPMSKLEFVGLLEYAKLMRSTGWDRD